MFWLNFQIHGNQCVPIHKRLPEENWLWHSLCLGWGCCPWPYPIRANPKASKGFPQGKGSQSLHKTQCFPIYSLILATGNPTVDYLSLDIEGAEIQVLYPILSPTPTWVEIQNLNWCWKFNAGPQDNPIWQGGHPDYLCGSRQDWYWWAHWAEEDDGSERVQSAEGSQDGLDICQVVVTSDSIAYYEGGNAKS